MTKEELHNHTNKPIKFNTPTGNQVGVLNFVYTEDKFVIVYTTPKGQGASSSETITLTDDMIEGIAALEGILVIRRDITK